MSWLNPPVHVAAELAPTVWTFAVAERRRDGTTRLSAARAIDATRPTLADDVRAFRRAARLPMDVSVILWPRAGDDGVVSIWSNDHRELRLPKARVIRDRVAALVRAGGLVTEVWLPHECFAAIAASRGERSACVIVAHPGLMCIGVVDNGLVRARYLASMPPAGLETEAARPLTESARLLARYQHIAMLAPHVRDLGGAEAGMRVFVAGQVPSLRGAMVPLVEELGRDIDILDADVLSPSPHALEVAEADELAGVQMAWVGASRVPQP